MITHSCAWCAAPAVEARGVYLERVSNGRRICEPCGRFTLHCECQKAGDPVPSTTHRADVLLQMLSDPGLLE